MADVSRDDDARETLRDTERLQLAPLLGSLTVGDDAEPMLSPQGVEAVTTSAQRVQADS